MRYLEDWNISNDTFNQRILRNTQHTLPWPYPCVNNFSPSLCNDWPCLTVGNNWLFQKVSHKYFKPSYNNAALMLRNCNQNGYWDIWPFLTQCYPTTTIDYIMTTLPQYIEKYLDENISWSYSLRSYCMIRFCRLKLFSIKILTIILNLILHKLPQERNNNIIISYFEWSILLLSFWT